MENPFEIIDKRLTAIEGKLEALIQRIDNPASESRIVESWQLDFSTIINFI